MNATQIDKILDHESRKEAASIKLALQNLLSAGQTEKARETIQSAYQRGTIAKAEAVRLLDDVVDTLYARACE